ncbi:MAG: succinylglutamate desuccinylase/aspartoacylase family protein [Psychrobium sp.]|nr:succinylglutamate desuccinylase/aspartoacylase family protein [Psychrobium sp.]
MKKLLSICALSFSAILLTACTSNNESVNTQACNAGNVILTADFATGRMDECKLLGNNEYLITLIPENTPINSSPWYAFKIQAKQPTPIKVTMVVKGDKHRYLPKISKNGKDWQLQPYHIDGKRWTINIDASQDAVYISGQEIIDNQYYIDWAKSLQNKVKISHEILGKSTQGRPLYQIESNSHSNEWVVVLGRMHPPEVTGALALFPFVENLMSNKAFIQRFNVLVIPNLNPDGVAMGNWRHNANGVDLNRDWKTFKQVESRLVRDKLNAITAAGGNIVFALDFHSTRKDIFYTMPSSYGLNPPHLVENWLGALEKIVAPFVVRQQPGNNPDKGVFKQYIADTFNVHAITYEMGDNTDRAVIDDIAQQASNTLMKTLLNTSANEFTSMRKQ